MALQFKSPAVQPTSAVIDPVMTVAIADLRDDDPRLQKRVEKSNAAHVQHDLLVKLNEGVELDPVEVVRETLDDGTVILWLWHGHNRKEAHSLAGRTVIKAKVRNGTFQDARRLALTPNNDHGLKLTDADKQHTFDLAVVEYKKEIEDGTCGINELARRTNLSPAYISKRMQSLNETGEIKKPETTTATRKGKKIAISTKGITGRKPNATIDELKTWIGDWVIDHYPDTIAETLRCVAMNSEKAESVYIKMCGAGLPTPHRQPDIMEAARQLANDEVSSQIDADEVKASEQSTDPVIDKPEVASVSSGSVYVQAKEPTLCVVMTHGMAKRMLEIARNANDDELVYAIQKELDKVAK